ncbi:unnamed protein product [Prunus armeniaca]
METFDLVAKLNTVRVLLSLAANHDWPLLQFDVKNVFLHGDLKEEIYMNPPPGIPVTSKEGMVCKLRKSLYGLKQSPRAWFGRFATSMRKSGKDHMAAVTRILRYLKVTPGNGLMFSTYGHTNVEGYTDTDWAGSATDRRSTSRYFAFVGGNLVTWRSKKQKVVSRSSAEAEYRGMAHGLDAEIVSFPFISSEYQLADVLTKAVSTSIFYNSLDKLGMRDVFAPT